MDEKIEIGAMTPVKFLFKEIRIQTEKKKINFAD